MWYIERDETDGSVSLLTNTRSEEKVDQSQNATNTIILQ